MVECVDYHREDEMGSGGVFIHGCACSLSLPHTELVNFLRVFQRGQSALLDVVNVNHAGVGVFAQLEFGLF